MIRIKGLSKRYGHQEVIKNINLEFARGRTYGIVGENGAGKTTLFRCIAGLESFEGEIQSDLNPLKNHLGLLFTEPYFFSKITGYEYIRLLCSARGKKATDIDEKNIFDLPLNRYASTYSTGMKKKLAIMAILLQENHFFILDEPFNGLDIQSNILVTEIIAELKRLEKVVLISSHIFSTLCDTCDHIFLLKEGELVRNVAKAGFLSLEAEMKEMTVGNRVQRLQLK